MPENNFLSLISEYITDSKIIANISDGCVEDIVFDQTSVRLAISVRFSNFVNLELLHVLENYMKNAIKINDVVIKAHFDSALFCCDFIKSLVGEVKHRGALINGFLEDAEYVLEKDTINIVLNIPLFFGR